MLSSMFNFTDERWAIWFPVCLMVCDFVTGFIKGWVKGKLSSKVMRVGLAKKICELILIVLVLVSVIAIGVPSSLVTITSIYVCITEAVSIIENLDAIGVKIPKVIRNAIRKAKEGSE